MDKELFSSFLGAEKLPMEKLCVLYYEETFIQRLFT